MIQLQTLNKVLQEHNTDFLVQNNLTAEYFSDFPEEYSYIQEHINNYGQLPDIETFLSKFPSFDVIQVKETYPYLLQHLFEDYNKRFLVKTFNQIREALIADNVDKAMSIYKASTDNQRNLTGTHSVDILSDTSRYDAYLERTEDFKKYYVSTGFPELDAVIGGWDRQEELATISARPNVGKSYILIKCALSAAEQGLNVGIYSGEMSENKVGYRIDTLLSHISNTSLIHGNANVKNDYKRYLESVKERVKGSIKVLTPVMISGPAGVSALRAFIERDNLDILFVDQHSLLEDDRKAKNPVEKAANISRDLKNLQVLKRIPIIAVSQQNRTSTENGVGTEHIAQSDRIAQDSTILIFLEQKDGVLTMSLVKSRDSANGLKIKYMVDFDHGKFTYIPNEETPGDDESIKQLQREFEDPTYSGEDPF